MKMPLFDDLAAGGEREASALARITAYQTNPLLAPLLKYILPAGLIFHVGRRAYVALPEDIKKRIRKGLPKAGAGSALLLLGFLLPTAYKIPLISSGLGFSAWGISEMFVDEKLIS